MFDLSDKGREEFYRKIEKIRIGIAFADCRFEMKKYLYGKVYDYERRYEGAWQESKSLNGKNEF